MITFDIGFFLRAFPYLLSYLPVTLAMVGLTTIFSLCIGALLAKIKIKNKKSAVIANIYIAVIRCTPPIVLLFMVYYGLPLVVNYFFGTDLHTLDKLVYVVIAFTLLFAATIAEIMRSAFLAVDKGQYEAGVSIGLSPLQTFWRIQFPQAARVALPNFVSALIMLLKDGALAYTIGLIDIMGAGNLLISQNYGSYSLETFSALAVVYWVFTIAIQRFGQLIEHRLTVDKIQISRKELPCK